MAAYRRVYDSRHLRLTAKNWDQLWNPTLGNRVWATFTFSIQWGAAAMLPLATSLLQQLAASLSGLPFCCVETHREAAAARALQCWCFADSHHRWSYFHSTLKQWNHCSLPPPHCYCCCWFQDCR